MDVHRRQLHIFTAFILLISSSISCSLIKTRSEAQDAPRVAAKASPQATSKSESPSEPICSKETIASLPGHPVANRRGYSISFNQEHGLANWVAHELTREMVEAELADTNRHYKKDPNFETADEFDIKRAGYQNGHLVPAEDMEFTRQTFDESNLMGNIAPQKGEFNLGQWGSLEKRVREWTKVYDRLFIVTGPILKPGLAKLPGTNTSMPLEYYKVIMGTKFDDPRTPEKEGAIRMIAYILRHGKLESFGDYATTVDLVERETSIDFFGCLKDSIEEDRESKLELTGWGNPAGR